MRDFTNTLLFNKKRQGSTYRQLHPPQLLHSINNKSWSQAILRTKTHPRETRYRDRWGNTPLHVACLFQDVPIKLVSLLLESIDNDNGESASLPRVDGCTPLHLACSHRASPKLLRLLLRHGGNVTALTRSGKSALHYACGSFRGLSVEALRVLLEEGLLCPRHDDGRDRKGIRSCGDSDVAAGMIRRTSVMFCRDDGGQTPLELLQKRYSERMSRAVSRGAERIPNVLGEFWSKACLLLRAAYYGFGEMSTTTTSLSGSAKMSAPPTKSLACYWGWDLSDYDCVVHASVGIGSNCVPPELVGLALAIHPEQVELRDAFGNLPIHIAARAFPNPNGLMTTLVDMFPRGVEMADHGGNLPLVLAVQDKRNVWREDVKVLLKAFPAAVECCLSEDRCFPHLLALIVREYNGDGCCLDVMYDLMKAKPEVLIGAAGGIRTC